MSIFVEILQDGTNGHGVTVEDFNAIATDFLSDGVVGAITNTAGVAPATGAFAVNASSNMTLAVTAGKAYVTGTPTSGVSQRVRVNMDANQNVTIASNSTGGTRYDWIYIKLDPDKMKDPSATADDVATLVTSRSTSSSTDNGTPPTFGYCIAKVTVANGASSIANGSITDARGYIDLATEKDFVKAVNRQNLPGTNATVSNQLIQTGWSYVLGSGTPQVTATVTFPVAFDDKPIIFVTIMGYKAGSDPSDIDDFTQTDSQEIIHGKASATTLSIHIINKDSNNTGATARYGFQWMAIGTKAR